MYLLAPSFSGKPNGIAPRRLRLEDQSKSALSWTPVARRFTLVGKGVSEPQGDRSVAAADSPG